MSPGTRARLQLHVMLAVAALAVGGCDEERRPEQFSVLVGKVMSSHADTGELSVRGAARKDQEGADRTIQCLITRDSEIYVNDMLSSIEDIQLGDAIELIGREDAAAEPARFLVSYAYVEHPMPPAPPPELTPASSPATQGIADNSED